MNTMHVEPVLIVVFYSSLAALAAILGAVPFARPSGVGRQAIGIAYACASGLMLGASYLLASEGLSFDPIWVVLGAAIGVAYSWSAQAFAGTAELQPDAEEMPNRAEYGYKILIQDSLHSASEGLAIGVAMALELPLGIFMAAALAVHNIAEAMALTSLLRKRGVSLRHSATLCVATEAPQVVVAVASFSLSQALISWLPLFLGAAAGSMVFLIMTELLPSSYRRCERANVAFLVSLATGIVVLLEEFFV